jgi:hypothetical protein
MNGLFPNCRAAFHPFGVSAELFSHFKAGGAFAYVGNKQFQVAESRLYPLGT